MKLTYIGHSAFYLEEGNFKALIDPFITGNPQANIDVQSIKSLTHIFVTHGHGDHLGDTLSLAKKHNALVITNFEIANYLATEGITAHPMHIGGRYKFDFGVVKMTPALHGSGIQTENGIIDGGNPAGFVITVKDKTIYHAGDTGLTLDMKLLQEENIDIALLPIGGNFTMDIRDAKRATDFIQAKFVVPMHYNTFDLIRANPEEFKNVVEASEVEIMTPGSSINL